MDTIDKLELKQLLDDRDDRLLESLGTMLERKLKAVMVASGVIKSYINKQEAYVRHGRRYIDKWIAEGYLRQIKEGDEQSCQCRIAVDELEACAARFNHPARVKGKIRTRRTSTGVDYKQPITK